MNPPGVYKTKVIQGEAYDVEQELQKLCIPWFQIIHLSTSSVYVPTGGDYRGGEPSYKVVVTAVIVYK